MAPWWNDHVELFSAVLVVAAYFAVATWETLAPQILPRPGQGPRWLRSGSLYATGLVATSVCFPIAASTVVDWTHLHNFGVFNQLTLPPALVAVLGVLLLDFGDYLTHRLMHAVPVLWRFHSVHHSDLDCDCATDLLHHPVEVVLVGALYFAQLLLWGLPYECVLAFAVLGIVSGPWQHGNLKLPAPVQRIVGKVLVTPEMHRIHHSSVARDGNRNFSVVFPWWDGCFGTAAKQPSGGWSALRFGLAEQQNPEDVTFWKLLLKPLGVYSRARFR